MRNFYAFEYSHGRNTTTSDMNNRQVWIAGQLYKFPSKAARQAWVNASQYDARRGRHQDREAVTLRNLPHGWKASDAQSLDDDE